MNYVVGAKQSLLDGKGEDKGTKKQTKKQKQEEFKRQEDQHQEQVQTALASTTEFPLKLNLQRFLAEERRQSIMDFISMKL